jgi:hypothetical protein
MRRMNVIVAAAHFGVCRRTIHNWVEEGRLERDDRGLILVPDGFVGPKRKRVSGAAEPCASESDARDPSERYDKIARTEQVVSALRYGPLTFWQLAERLPGTRAAISGAVRRAREDGLIARDSCGTWCLTASLSSVCNEAGGV